MMLYTLTSQASALYQMLESGEIDEQVFRDTLEAMSGEVEELCKLRVQLAADAAALRAESKRLSERAQELEAGEKRIRTSLLEFMQASGAKSTKAGSFSLSLKRSKKVEIAVPLTDLPERFLRIKREANRVALKHAIDAGEEIDGVSLSDTVSLIIR